MADADDVKRPTVTDHRQTQSGLNPLTPRETTFVHEFAKDVNAVEAAKRAGYQYKDVNDAYKLLERPNIQHAIMIMMNAREKSLDLTTQRVIEEMAAIAFANIGDFVDWNAGAVMVRGKNMIEAEKLNAIAEITEVTLPNGMTTIRFKLHNKLKALEDLLAYTQKKDESVDSEATGLAEELTRRRQKALARAAMEAQLEAEDAEEAHRVVRESPSDRDVLDEALDDEETE
jgi:phage terminase small subunit